MTQEPTQEPTRPGRRRAGTGATARADLVARLRTLLAGEPTTREVSMFGGLAFMVDDAMVVSALAGGDLLVRVAADQHETLAARPGAAQAEMGAGRSMGPGWIQVDATAIVADDDLTAWLGVALEHRRGQPDRGRARQTRSR